MKKNSFTMLEVILAISVLTLAVGGSFGLLQQTLSAASLSNSKLVAAYLAQEGIEIIRNVRDSNWLEGWVTGGSIWKQGLESGVYEASYNDLTLSLLSGDPRNLYINAGGFYSYSADNGAETKFKRIIVIEDGEDVLDVSVNVQWQEKVGGIKNFIIRERLYNWAGY